MTKISYLRLPNGRASLRVSQMSYRRKALLMGVLILIIVSVHLILPGNAAAIDFYSGKVFKPFQNGRNFLFGWLPFSFGDVLYVIGGVLALAGLVKWLYFLIRLRSHRHDMLHSVMRTVNVMAIAYLIFLVGYGGNYYKPSLIAHWDLHTATWSPEALVSYDSFLISRLNAIAPVYRPQSFREVEQHSHEYYLKYTNSRTGFRGLGAKRTLFGYFLQYFGIQGYYNPFTGEAQVNSLLPSFMQPFVVCHEMAHQSGIAAEDDANLLSYAVCTTVPDTTFGYSGYFNLWLYTHARLRELDSAQAKTMYETLNPLTKAQVDTLRAIRRQFRSNVGEISGQLYDGYLRWHNQKEGIESYFKVAVSAWAYDRQRKAGAMVSIP